MMMTYKAISCSE